MYALEAAPRVAGRLPPADPGARGVPASEPTVIVETGGLEEYTTETPSEAKRRLEREGWLVQRTGNVLRLVWNLRTWGSFGHFG